MTRREAAAMLRAMAGYALADAASLREQIRHDPYEPFEADVKESDPRADDVRRLTANAQAYTLAAEALELLASGENAKAMPTEERNWSEDTEPFFVAWVDTQPGDCDSRGEAETEADARAALRARLTATLLGLK